MVKSVYVEKRLSKNSEKEYFSVIFDCDYRQVYLFADTQTLLVLTGLPAEEFFALKIGDKVKLI